LGAWEKRKYKGTAHGEKFAEPDGIEKQGDGPSRFSEELKRW